MTELHEVPVKTLLRPSTWRAFEREAKQRGMTVGHLLSHMADRALQPKAEPQRRRTYTRMTPERIARMRELEAQGMPRGDIARELGVSRSTIENHINRVRHTTEGEPR